jgi:hypothetical protein
LVVRDGYSDAPQCVGNAGKTGGNNLTLGKCSAAGGSKPHITFTESD